MFLSAMRQIKLLYKKYLALFKKPLYDEAMKTKTGFTKKYLLSKLVEASELLGHSPSQRNIERMHSQGFPSRCA